MSFEMVYVLGVTMAACMLTFRAMFLRCWRICMVCLALELISSWVVVGFSVGMEAFEWSHYLMFHVVSFLVFSGFRLKSPASGIQVYSSNSLKTSPTIQH